MWGYLMKILLLFVSCLFVIQQYYQTFNHTENFNWYTIYIIILTLIYGVYKYFQISDKNSDTFSISLPAIIWFIWLHLFILSGMFFVYQNMSFAMGLILFFKILWFLLLPILFSFISLSTWKKILSYIEGFQSENEVFKNVISLVFGFFLVLTTIVIVWMLWFYNIYSIVAILLWYLVFSWKESIEYINYFIDYKFNFSKSEWYWMKLLSTEFLFILSTLLISVNLISAFRPFPIGWDDLWAYMNYAQLLAESWSIFNVTSMFSWQIFTGIWYIFNSPTQAFFLNNLGWILSFILLVAIFSDLLQSKIKKFFINIPLLLSTIFIAMPMFIFEQAKDMKLDPGLFFVSIASVYLIIKLLLNSHKSENNNNFKNKILSFFGNTKLNIGSKYIYFFIIWILLWFTFSIKFTSLLLVSGVFALLFYARLWTIALFWYMGIFFAIFTKFGLWKMMNVSYPSDDVSFINNFSGISAVIGIVLLIYSFVIHKDKIKWFIIKLFSILLGIIIALLPWFVFNISTSDNINISTLLSGETDYLKIDYTELYSQEELDQKIEDQKQFTLSSTWTTWNEDWGRYFGYEEGINNYIKLPWNLSMQENQRGEFTDITYIYLTLLPLILLFLPFRNKYYSLWVVVIFLIGVLLFVNPASNIILTDFLSKYTLPGWYWLLLLGFVLPLLYLLLSVKNSGKGKLFKYITVFTFFYTFLWTIAAYGVVWYWIVMYFWLLLIIGICLFYASSYDDKSEEKEKQIKLLWSWIIFTIIAIYFFASSFPHAFTNLKTASYTEFKSWDVASVEAPYLYHWDYLKIVYELNILHEKKSDFISSTLTENTKKLIISINTQNEKWESQLQRIDVDNIENLVLNLRSMRNNQSFSKYHKDLSTSLTNIYKWISHPSEEFKNTKYIYRIGTFLKYYISENNNRLFEDALVMKFDTYIKWATPDTTVDNMKKLGLNYFLVDLNAATIDNDPRRNLTKRYEWLLETFTSDKLEFISSDSICLRLGRELYMRWEKNEETLSNYITLAGVNHTSYNPDGSLIKRQDKQLSCYNTILELIQEWKVNNTDYSYLLAIQNYIISHQEIHGDIQALYKVLIKMAPHGYKILFRIKD